jgi:hypothetical protein
MTTNPPQAQPVETGHRSWQLMRCDRCDYSERMSLVIASIACPKKCKGVMRPADGGIARRLVGYEK